MPIFPPRPPGFWPDIVRKIGLPWRSPATWLALAILSFCLAGCSTSANALSLVSTSTPTPNLALTQAALSGGLGTGVNVAGGSTQSLMLTLNGNRVLVLNLRVNF